MPIKISVRPQFQKDLKNLAPKEQKALQEAINNFRNNKRPLRYNPNSENSLAVEGRRMAGLFRVPGRYRSLLKH